VAHLRGALEEVTAMRELMLVTAMLIGGCATQTGKPQSAPGTWRPTLTDAQRSTLAKNLNLKLVDQDGQQVYCRSNFETGSRIRRDTTCYTADQLDLMEAQMQRDLDQFSLRSAAGGMVIGR
jgi:hypothetical protein